ncbi:MAG TPA: metallopeptidase TldD-related protein, partial [Acidimicrobiales bacterium]|nr:metallopeptidase TldD-related protein [Acidimicrobiales bacterium]
SSSRRTGCHLSVEAIAGDSRSDEQYTAVGYSVGRGPGDLDPEEAAADGTTRALRLLGATKPASAHVTVVLDRRVASTLLSIIGGTLSGEDVMKGRSLFGGRLGEDVAVAGFTLFEDATDPHAYGASRFDAEGLACRRVPLIEAGRLTGYLYNTYGARMAGVASTASAVRGGYRTTPGTGARALAIEPGELDFDRILKQVGDGLYVQSISGVHSGVNPISGDFSVGAVGLFVKDGELAAPVREVTIASTIQRMMQRIVAVGSDLEWPPGSACGVSLAIGDIAMSGA